MPIKVGIAGVRGLSNIEGFRAAPGVVVEALCDLDADILAEQAARYQIPKQYRVFEDMLASDIDAVVISTPMQCHVPQALLALEAGKHVFSEVTAGVTLDELWWLIETVEKTGKVYMMAENCCYLPNVQIIKAMVRQGLFGEVYFGEGEYIHEIKSRVHYPDGRPSWRKYWQYGKRGAFYPTHSVGPVLQWFGDDHIKSIISVGCGWHTAPEFRQEDTSVTLCQMESGKLIKLRVDCISNRPNNNLWYTLQGTLGCYEAPRDYLTGKHLVWLKGMDESTEKAKWRDLDEFRHLLPERYKHAEEAAKEAGHGGSDYFIVQDFIDAITQGGKPAIDVYEACEWTAVALLSELSVTNGGRAIDMPRFRKNMPREEQVLKLP